jgi:hypothetical protein
MDQGCDRLPKSRTYRSYYYQEKNNMKVHLKLRKKRQNVGTNKIHYYIRNIRQSRYVYV